MGLSNLICGFPALVLGSCKEFKHLEAWDSSGGQGLAAGWFGRHADRQVSWQTTCTLQQLLQNQPVFVKDLGFDE